MTKANKSLENCRYEFTEQQVENLKALIMDANIKGSAACAIVDLIKVLDNPVVEAQEDDLHRKHHHRKRKAPTRPKEK